MKSGAHPINNLVSETWVIPHPGFEKPGYPKLEYSDRDQDTVAGKHLIQVSDHVYRCAINSNCIVSKTRYLMVNNVMINTLHY